MVLIKHLLVYILQLDFFAVKYFKYAVTLIAMYLFTLLLTTVYCKYSRIVKVQFKIKKKKNTAEI